MYYLVPLLAAAALLCAAHAASVTKEMKVIKEMDNEIESNVPAKKRVALSSRPPVMSSRVTSGRVELTCDALGVPAPSVHWYRDDVPVYQHGLESNEVVSNKPASLARIIATLLAPASRHAHTYTCAVVAGPKTYRASTVVNGSAESDLPERTHLTPLAPRILVSYRFYLDEIGGDIALPCRVRAHPRPALHWLDNNGTRVHHSDRMKVLRSGALVIRALRWSDLGEYTCRATNAYGAAAAATFLYPKRPANRHDSRNG